MELLWSTYCESWCNRWCCLYWSWINPNCRW